MKHTQHNNEPLFMRLMMAMVFWPIVMACFAIVYLVLLYMDASEFNVTVLGIPLTLFLFIVLVIVPAACWLLILWKGSWRPAVIVLTLNFVFGLYFSAGDNHYTKPEKRMINIGNSSLPTGADVYCNGVLLGQAPFSISVADLKVKVPEWSTPPEQKWFVDRINPVYTWYPWDRFDRERYEEFRALDAKKSTLEFDTAGKYWWKIEHNGTTMCFCDQRVNNMLYQINEHYSFDRIGEYSLYPIVLHTPAKQAVSDLVFGTYDQLDDQEKTILAKYVAALPPGYFDYYDDSRRELLELTARAKYGFEKNPSQAECRRVLEQIIEDDDIHSLSLSQYGVSYIVAYRGDLTSHVLSQLGDNAIEPIRQLLRQHWYDESDKAAAVLLAGLPEKVTPELFDDLVRYYALSDRTMDAVLSRNDERTVPLFHSIMDNRTLAHRMQRTHEAASKIKAMASISNKPLEPHIRNKIHQLLKNSYWDDQLDSSLNIFVSGRARQSPDDREELQRWVESLTLPSHVKEELLMKAAGTVIFHNWTTTAWGRIPVHLTSDGSPIRSLGELSETTLIFYLGEKPITTTMLCDWLREHPGKDIGDYYNEIDTANVEEHPQFVMFSLNALVRDPSPEAGDILKDYWNDPDKKEKLMSALGSNFVVFQSIGGGFNYQLGDRGSVRLPGFYYDLVDATVHYPFSDMTSVNPAVVEMFREITDVQFCIGFINTTADIYVPGAADLVETWSHSEDKRLRERATDALAAIRMRERIRTQSRELLMQLVAGKITPDDLLPKTAPWVWENGKYVQK